MTKKEGLIEFYKENHKEGDLFCVVYKKIYDSMEKNTIEVSMFENLTGLEDFLNIYNDDLFYETDTGSFEVEYIYYGIIDCYFSTKEQEDYKEKYILSIKE